MGFGSEVAISLGQVGIWVGDWIEDAAGVGIWIRSQDLIVGDEIVVSGSDQGSPTSIRVRARIRLLQDIKADQNRG